MRGAARLLIVPVAVSTLSGAAAAVEVQPSISSSASYTDNLFSTQRDTEDDWFFTGTPGLAVYDESGQLQWRFSFEPTYVAYVDHEDLSGWEHDLEGSVAWHITPRTVVRASERFRRMDSISRFNEQADIAGQPAGIDGRPDRDRFKRNLATFGIEHTLTPRTFLYANYTNAILDFTRDDIPDRDNQSAAAGFSYLLRKNLRTGLRVGWSQSEIKPENAPSRTGDFYNASLTANWTPSPRTTLELSAGPTLVKNDAGDTSFQNPRVLALPVQQRSNGVFYTRLSTCPQLGDGTFYFGLTCEPSPFPNVQNAVVSIPQVDATGGVDDTDVTFFATANLTHEWDDWKLDLDFVRQDDNAVSTGVSGVINVGSVRLEYAPFPRWRFIASASYILRESTTDSVVNLLTLSEAPLVPIIPGFFNQPGAGLDVAQSNTRQLTKFSAENQVETWRTFVKAVYQASERVWVTGTLFWTDERQELDGTLIRKYDRFTGWIGVTYEFDPILL